MACRATSQRPSCKASTQTTTTSARGTTPIHLKSGFFVRFQFENMIYKTPQLFGCKGLYEIFFHALKFAHQTVSRVAVGRHHDNGWTLIKHLHLFDGVEDFPAGHIG